MTTYFYHLTYSQYNTTVVRMMWLALICKTNYTSESDIEHKFFLYRLVRTKSFKISSIGLFLFGCNEFDKLPITALCFKIGV